MIPIGETMEKVTMDPIRVFGEAFDRTSSMPRQKEIMNLWEATAPNAYHSLEAC
jgi:hypothetical protein